MKSLKDLKREDFGSSLSEDKFEKWKNTFIVITTMQLLIYLSIIIMIFVSLKFHFLVIVWVLTMVVDVIWIIIAKNYLRNLRRAAGIGSEDVREAFEVYKLPFILKLWI